MANKNLKQLSSSSSEEYSSEEDVPKVVLKKPQTPSAASVLVAQTMAKPSKEKESSDEEESSEYSSEEDDAKNPQAPSASVLVAPASVKTKAKTKSSKEKEELSDEKSTDEEEKQSLVVSHVSAAEAKKKASFSRDPQATVKAKVKTKSSKEKEEKQSSVFKGEAEKSKKVSSSRDPPKRASVAVPKSEKAKKKRKVISSSVDEGNVIPSKEDKAGEKSNERKLFQKLLSEEDELRLLEGIIEFKNQTGMTPNQDKNGFYKFVKDSFELELTLSQCMGKIETFRRNYEKKVFNGKKPSSSNAYDLKSFEFCERIWGAEVARKTERMKKIKEEKDVRIDEQEEDLLSNSALLRLLASFGSDEDSLKTMWDAAPTKMKQKIQEKWRVLRIKELEVVSEKTGLVTEIFSAITQASSSL